MIDRNCMRFRNTHTKNTARITGSIDPIKIEIAMAMKIGDITKSIKG